jgi:hypothetical protein
MRVRETAGAPTESGHMTEHAIVIAASTNRAPELAMPEVTIESVA